MNLESNRFVVFDIETTGLNPLRGHKIIEIGAVAINDRVICEEFESLIDIKKSIPKTACKIHGTTTEMLSGQPETKEVLKAFREFIGRSILVAHNADFDMGFLRWECSRTGLSLSNRCICTLELSKTLYPGLSNYKLGTVARHALGMEMPEGRCHRALDDARLTARIWLKMRETA